MTTMRMRVGSDWALFSVRFYDIEQTQVFYWGRA
jgi:hypothetical protein